MIYIIFFPASLFCQTRSLLSVFEEDAGMLTNYTNQLLQSLQRVFGAQVLCVNFVPFANVRAINIQAEENQIWPVMGTLRLDLLCWFFFVCFPVIELCVRSGILYNVNICIF